METMNNTNFFELRTSLKNAVMQAHDKMSQAIPTLRDKTPLWPQLQVTIFFTIVRILTLNFYPKHLPILMCNFDH